MTPAELATRLEAFRTMLHKYATAVEHLERAHIQGTRAEWETAEHVESGTRLAINEWISTALHSAEARGWERAREEAARPNDFDTVSSWLTLALHGRYIAGHQDGPSPVGQDGEGTSHG